MTHLSKALELIVTLPNTPERLDDQLALLLALGGPLIATRGHAAPEVHSNYRRALALCEQLGRSAERFPVLRGLWNYHLARGEHEQAYDFAKKLVALADKQEAPLRRALARRALGTALFFRGEFSDAKAELDEGVAIDDLVAHWENPAHLLLYTESAGVVCRQFLALSLWFLGFPDRALETVEAALDLAQRLNHPSSLAFAQNFASLLHCFRREFAKAQKRAQETIDLANDHPLPEWGAEAQISRGFALVGPPIQRRGSQYFRPA